MSTQSNLEQIGQPEEDEWEEAREWLSPLMDATLRSSDFQTQPIPFDILDLISDYASTAWNHTSFLAKLSEDTERLLVEQDHDRVAAIAGAAAIPPVIADQDSEFELIQTAQLPRAGLQRNLKRLADALFCRSYWLTLNGLTTAGARWVVEEVIAERELVSPGALFYARCLWMEYVSIADADLEPLFELFERNIMPRLLWIGLSGCQIAEPSTLHRLATLRLSGKLTSLEWIELSATPLATAMDADTSHPSWADYKVLKIMGTQIRFG